MDSENIEDEPFDFTDANVQRLKYKYSTEMKDEPDNPIKICMKMIFDAATEKSPYRRSSIAYDLSKFLTKSDGVINLSLALIDFDTSSQKITTHNQRFMAMSNIITCLPKLCMPYEEYCTNIAKQLKPLIVCDNTKYSTLACIIVKSMIESPHARNKDIAKIILNPMFDALLLPNCSTKPHESIVAIHNLIHNHVSTELFVEMFSHLFYCLVVLNETPSRLKLLLKRCLVNILNGLKPGAACCLVERTLFFSKEICHLYTKITEEDGISIKVARDETEAEELLEVTSENIERIVISLLEASNNELLVLEFFFHFQETMWTARDDKIRQLSASLIEPLLNQAIQEESNKLDILSSIATNRGRALHLLSRTLLNYLAFLHCEKEDFVSRHKLVSQSISSCLTILEVLSATLCDDGDTDIIREKCLPVLRQILELLAHQDEQHQRDELYQNLESLVKRLENSIGESSKLQTSNDFTESELNSILKDLNDKLVPVRVHALVRLKLLILANDQYTILRIPQLYTMIEVSLADQEPYVFLACINLMFEMVLRKTDEILPKLIGLYSKQDLNLQHRINVGEVLVRLARQMNSTAPFYAQQVMNMLIKGRKDNEELMRMSSLTNIGEICRNLGDSLGKYVFDILDCVQAVIDDDTIPVKCAAIDLLRTTLSGLDGIKVESIQRELKTMYSLLKKLKCRTLDEKLCLQVDLALDELDRLAREMLGVNMDRCDGERLVKNIKVLSLGERQ